MENRVFCSCLENMIENDIISFTFKDGKGLYLISNIEISYCPVCGSVLPTIIIFNKDKVSELYNQNEAWMNN